MNEIILTDQNFEEEVIKSDSIPILVDFWALWCKPCRMIDPIIKELAEEFKGKIKVGKFNVDENPETASRYEVISIPCLKIFKDGKVIDEIVGLQPKKVIVEKINKALE